MWRRHGISLAALLALSIAGCGKSADPSSPAAGGEAATTASAAKPATQDGPAAAVYAFLEAVRTGNDEKAAAMLTPLARQRTKEENLEVAPPGSDTAKFTVGRVEYVAQDGARVATTWTDLDENSKERSDEMLWMVQKEPEGWRIAGVAATIFPGEPPLKLNFEDPKDMIQKQKLVEEEMRRRAEQQTAQAQGKAKAQDPVRR